MNLSAIQLEGYALIEMAYRANQDYRPGSPTMYAEEEMAANVTLERDPKDSSRWTMTMKFQLQPRTASNGPYHVALQLAGVFATAPDFTPPDIETLVRVNGASVLYGVAREIVRQVTSAGPYPGMLIPTVNFRPDSKPEPKQPELPVAPAP
ncbi:MAG TPA: protein-export chaperone SecB [Opitutaceae bacterium]|nr:protein-export chaperone SecB [Opitutaceae bacterium]